MTNKSTHPLNRADTAQRSFKPLRVAVSTVVMVAACASAPSMASVVLGDTMLDALGPGNPGCFDVVHASDQSGLSAGYTSGVTAFTVAASDTHSQKGCTSAKNGVVLSTFILYTMDLGSVQAVDGLAYWRARDTEKDIPQLGPMEPPLFDVFADGDSNPNNGPGSLIGSFQGGYSDGPLVNALVVSLAPTSARYFHFRSTLPTSVGNVGIGEIAFRATAVPEPQSLALAGLGLLLCGLTRRRQHG